MYRKNLRKKNKNEKETWRIREMFWLLPIAAGGARVWLSKRCVSTPMVGADSRNDRATDDAL